MKLDDNAGYAVVERKWNGSRYDDNGRVWTGDDLAAAIRRRDHLLERRTSLEALDTIYSVYDQRECDWI